MPTKTEPRDEMLFVGLQTKCECLFSAEHIKIKVIAQELKKQVGEQIKDTFVFSRIEFGFQVHATATIEKKHVDRICLDATRSVFLVAASDLPRQVQSYSYCVRGRIYGKQEWLLISATVFARDIENESKINIGVILGIRKTSLLHARSVFAIRLRNS
jgi:hypothetical protein